MSHGHHHDHEHDHDHGHDHCHGGCCCGHDHGREESVSKKKIILRYVLGAIPIIVAFMGFIPFYIPLVAAIVGYLCFGVEVFEGMLRGFAKKKPFTEFTLMCVATLGAFAIGEYADAAALMYLYSLGETVSDGAYAKSKKSISSLIELTPETVSVLRGEKIHAERLESVRRGELILVRAGERVPLDCAVVSGGGDADTSSVTGEAKPLALYEGVECPSGALLLDGSVTLRVIREHEDSVVSRLKKAVRTAERRKSAAEKKISRFAALFTPIAFGAALLVFAVGTLITKDAVAWARAAITVLVVSCPCSLVISVPLTYFAGLGCAASEGIVFRGGEVMDRAAKLGLVAFDKTGTLTDSALVFDGAVTENGVSEPEFLSLSAAVLTHSPHAAARSFCREHTQKGEYKAESVENIAGRGVVCTVNGETALFGNARLLAEHGIKTDACEVTCIYGALGGRLLGRLEFSSHLKADVRASVERMRALGVKKTAVISGDAPASVKASCEAAGIDEFYSGAAPDRKLEIFEKLSESTPKGKYSAYCGDGLNDSAVIAAADVGIAMGACGSALTVESADIVLMDDSIEKINTAILISRRTERVANSNIALSLGIKIGVLLAGVLLAALKLGIPIELAVVADVGAALIAVLNSRRAAKKSYGEMSRG